MHRRNFLSAFGASLVLGSGCSSQTPEETVTNTHVSSPTISGPQRSTEHITDTETDTPTSTGCDRQWNPTVSWEYTAGSSIRETAITSDSVVCGSIDGTIQGIAIADGGTRWSVDQKAIFDIAVPADSRQVVYGADTDSRTRRHVVVAVDPQTGTSQWEFQTEEKAEIDHMDVTGEVVVVVTSKLPTAEISVDNPYWRVSAIERATGETRWQYTLAQDMTIETLATVEGRVFIIVNDRQSTENGETTYQPQLRALSPQGEEQWVTPFADRIRGRSLITRLASGQTNETIVLNLEGELIGVALADGTIRWRGIQCGGTPKMTTERVYAFQNRQDPATVQAIDIDAGTIEWQWEVPDETEPSKGMDVSRQILYVPTEGANHSYPRIDAFDALEGCFLGNYMFDPTEIDPPHWSVDVIQVDSNQLYCLKDDRTIVSLQN